MRISVLAADTPLWLGIATAGVALFAALTSSFSAAVAYKTYRRNRVRLEVSASYLFDPSRGHFLTVTVRNRGYHDATVSKVVLGSSFGRKTWSGLTVAENEVIGALSARTFEFDVDTRPLAKHVDQWLRPFVIDAATNKKSYGAPKQLYRELIAIGWKPPAGTKPTLTGPLRKKPKKPRRVPRWMVWRSADPPSEPRA